MVQLNSSKLFIFIFFFYCTFIIHTASYTPGGEGLYITSNIFGWIIISILISLGLYTVSKKQQIVFPPLIQMFLAGLALLIIPVFYEESSLYEIAPTFIAIGAGGLFLFCLYQFDFKRATKQKLILALIFGVSIESLLGLLQFFIFPLFNIDFHSYELLNQRPSGAFRQPNVMASFLVTGIFICLYFLKNEIKIANKKIIERIVYFTLFSSTLLIVLLQSKVGYLGFLLSFICIVPMLIKNISSMKIPLLILLAGALCGLLTMNSLQGLDRGEQLYKETGIRTDIYPLALKMISEQPLKGYGYGKFEREYREYHMQAMVKNPSIRDPRNLSHPHNEILLWGIGGGIIAILGLAVITIGILIIFKSNSTANGLALFSLLIPIGLHTQTELPFYTSLAHFIYFLVLVWFIDSESNTQDKSYIQSYLLARLFAFAIPLTAIPYLITTFQTSYYLSKFHKSEFNQMEYLERINNYSVWKSYLDKQIYIINFQIGSTSYDKKMLFNYVNWSMQEVKIRPRKDIYQKLIISIQILEDNGENVSDAIKEKIITDAMTLYPEQETWGLALNG